MSTLDQASAVDTPFLSEGDQRSILSAIRQEVEASGRRERSLNLDIDGIRHLQDTAGRFVYRIILSSPANFSPEQVLRFRVRHAKETIEAIVLACDDEGLVLETQHPLPADAKLVTVTFDPSFIYRAIGDYLVRAVGTSVAEDFIHRRLHPLPTVPNRSYQGLNQEQATAVNSMGTIPIHLLWGPPGTGKTTTLGVAVAEWLKRGKRVLVVSTSNAAVDVAMKAVLKRVPYAQRKHLLRLGTSLDPEVSGITLAGKLRDADCVVAAEARQAQDRLNELVELLSKRPISNDRFQTLYAEYSRLEQVVERANQKAQQILPDVMTAVRVMGCTLAKMVLDRTVNEAKYDFVVVDEVSMVSAVYGLAASTLAVGHLILAGDPKQLPPICQSNQSDAQKWFAASSLDWFGLGSLEDDGGSSCSLLRTQYRMTDEIGGVVSRLTYRGRLVHGRSEPGCPVEFVDLPHEWRTNHFSVRDKSYFHLSTVPIVHKLARFFEKYQQLLLLSPFRPQRSLLAALAFDIKERSPTLKASASTIHRAQGSESRGVILDLTTHDPEHLVAFFRDRHCENLFNVGISRARDRLVVLGNKNLIAVLSRESEFWKRLLGEFRDGVRECPACDLLDEPRRPADLEELTASDISEVESPGIYSHHHFEEELGTFTRLLGSARATRRLLVLPEDHDRIDLPDCVVRHASNLPPLLVLNGHLAIPFGNGWLATRSPNVARVVWRIGFSHLAEEEVNPLQARRFFCPECATGDLILRSYAQEGWFLVCTNTRDHECTYRRRLTLEDAKLKVKLQGMTCPSHHPLTVRQSGSRFFLGCENYPSCDHTDRLSLLDGM